MGATKVTQWYRCGEDEDPVRPASQGAGEAASYRPLLCSSAWAEHHESSQGYRRARRPAGCECSFLLPPALILLLVGTLKGPRHRPAL
eukprot:753925-Hanusia_phi.AAC.3